MRSSGTVRAPIAIALAVIGVALVATGLATPPRPDDATPLTVSGGIEPRDPDRSHCPHPEADSGCRPDSAG